VDYRRPSMVPGDVALQGADAVKTYLRETSQTYAGQFDYNRSVTYDGPVWMPTDDPLCEWNWATRKAILTNCHAAYHRNPLAKRAVDLTAQFAVGKGFNVTYQNKDVQEVLEEFISNPENNIAEYDSSLLKDLSVDGELFIRFFGSGANMVMVPVPPWYVTEIETEPEFFRRVKQYKLQYEFDLSQSMLPKDLGLEGKWVGAENMLHVAINRHSYELRGRPDLYVILPWLRAYKEWLEDRMRQNKWRGALLWWAKILKARPGQIANKRNQYKTPPEPGSTLVTGDNEEWSALSNPAGAPDVSEDGRQVKLMVAVGVGMPEYMLSDGENANLASATAQQLPAMWRFVDAQEIMRERVWTPIFQRVISAAVQDGKFAHMVPVQDSDGDPVLDGNKEPQEIEATRAFAVEYYALQSDDPKTMAEAISLDMANQLVSRSTAQSKRGYDSAREQKLMQRERQEQRDDYARGDDVTPENIGVPDDYDDLARSGNGDTDEAESKEAPRVAN